MGIGCEFPCSCELGISAPDLTFTETSRREGYAQLHPDEHKPKEKPHPAGTPLGVRSSLRYYTRFFNSMFKFVNFSRKIWGYFKIG